MIVVFTPKNKFYLTLLQFFRFFYHKNQILRDIVYMIMMFLNLLDTQEEKDSFLELYDTYKDLLYWIALKKTNSIEDAEECVQETFFYVAKHFDKIGEIKSKRTKCYLSTIVTGFAIDIYNDFQKSELISNDDNELRDIEYFENFEKVELTAVFDDILDEESKIFFYLKYIYNYKSSEIAEIYNVKDSLVRKKLQYAREKLKQYLIQGE